MRLCSRLALCALPALVPIGCVGTRAWLHEAEKARDPVALVGISATARDGGRLVQLRVEDEDGDVAWYRVCPGQTPVKIDEDQVLPGASIRVGPGPAAAPGAAVVVEGELPSPQPLIEVVFADGTSNTFVFPLVRTSGLSHLMLAFTPVVALGEAVLSPVLVPAYIVALLVRPPGG